MSQKSFSMFTYFNGCFLLSSSYYIHIQLKKLMKEYKKINKARILFKKIESSISDISTINSNNNLFILNDNVYLSGYAKKESFSLFSWNKTIISQSSTNTNYVENFIVKNNSTNFLIHPHRLSNYLSFKQRYITNFSNYISSKFSSMISYFTLTKSNTLINNEYVYLYGKLIKKNENKIIYDDYITNQNQIKLYSVSTKSFWDLKENCVSLFPIIKILIKIIFGGVLFSLSFKYFKNEIIMYFRKKKKKVGNICQICGQNYCNILCSKCENLTNYCDACYSNLQNLINNQTVSFNDIKCVHCQKILDEVDKLILSN